MCVGGLTTTDGVGVWQRRCRRGDGFLLVLLFGGIVLGAVPALWEIVLSLLRISWIASAIGVVLVAACVAATVQDDWRLFGSVVLVFLALGVGIFLGWLLGEHLKQS